VKRVSTSGGAVETLASGQSSLTGICATDTNVYWLSGASADGGVWTETLDGGAPVQLVPDRGSNSLTRIGDRLYWGSLRDNALNSVLLDGGAPASWPTPTTPTDIASDGQFLYFGGRSNGTGMFRIGFDGGAGADGGMQVATGDIVVRVAAQPGELAWVAVHLISGSPLQYVNAGVFVMPLDGGAATELAPLSSQTYLTATGTTSVIAGLASDTQSLYWTDLDGGAVFRARWSDGSVEPIAQGQERPVGLTEDDAAIYWSTFGFDGGGTLMKLAK
jgi:hypothetical protein